MILWKEACWSALSFFLLLTCYCQWFSTRKCTAHKRAFGTVGGGHRFSFLMLSVLSISERRLHVCLQGPRCQPLWCVLHFHTMKNYPTLAPRVVPLKNSALDPLRVTLFTVFPPKPHFSAQASFLRPIYPDICQACPLSSPNSLRKQCLHILATWHWSIPATPRQSLVVPGTQAPFASPYYLYLPCQPCSTLVPPILSSASISWLLRGTHHTMII